MNPGQIIGFLWTVAALFFLISVFAFPITFAYWRKREKADAAETDRVLKGLLRDTTNDHIYDA